MPLKIVRNDITRMKVDAIVNAANETLLGNSRRGGVDGRIHRAAGPELLEECRTLFGCEAGNAKITKGYNLPCKYVIHTVGPRWYDGRHGEAELLSSCYRTSLMLAKEYDCESIAFPIIASGRFAYPKEQAIKIANETIKSFLSENEMMVYLVVYGTETYQISRKLFNDITEYIDNSYVSESAHNNGISGAMYAIDEADEPAAVGAPWQELSLKDALEQTDDSFSAVLLSKIRSRHMTDVECYRKANIDRKLFSKIKKDDGYKPSKITAVAFGLALEMPLEEFKEFLSTAGFSLTHSDKFDIIVEYFVNKGNYDIFEINDVLFEFGQKTIGT